MKKNSTLAFIFILFLFILFIVLLYRNIEEDIIRHRFMEDDVMLSGLQPLVTESIEHSLARCDEYNNEIGIDSLLRTDTEDVEGFVESRYMLLNIPDGYIFKNGKDRFAVFNSYLAKKKLFPKIQSRNYRIELLGYDYRTVLNENTARRFRESIDSHRRFGFFRTSRHLFSYRQIGEGDYCYLVIITSKESIFRNLSEFSTLLAIVIFITLLSVLLFVMLFIKMNNRLIMMEERTRKQLEIMRLSKLISMDKLSESIIHNINNPLQSILGYIQHFRIKEQAKASEYRMERVEKNLKIIINQINILMDKTKKDMSEEMIDLDINNFIEETMLFYSSALQTRGIEYQMELDPGEPRIKASYKDISALVENIIDNAMDAMYQSDKRELTVKTIRDGRLLRIIISDSGEGMTDEEMERMYELYFTSKSDDSSGGPVGTGIGMFTVKHILDRNKWHMSVDSVKGQGSVFTVDIPLSKKQI
ncbi:MAG: ATP-binding protein [bacterium]